MPFRFLTLKVSANSSPDPSDEFVEDENEDENDNDPLRGRSDHDFSQKPLIYGHIFP